MRSGSIVLMGDTDIVTCGGDEVDLLGRTSAGREAFMAGLGETLSSGRGNEHRPDEIAGVEATGDRDKDSLARLGWFR
jgi:hypothetical protein